MKNMNTRGLLVVISAPSGAGKTTVCKKLLDEFPDLHFSVSFTTRPPRGDEKEGRDYHFISVEEFRDRIEKGEFVEWEELYGHFYGTSRREIEGSIMDNRDVLLDIDTKGARNVKKIYPDGVFVFIMPPSAQELKQRLKKRGSETEDTIKVRFERAMEEIRENEWYDYVIFNDILLDSVHIMRSIYTAEKNRRSRLRERINSFC